jgi:branched-chain amino acid transport system ATP-binding protein
MLAFGRAMIAQPSLILMDEPSLGLSAEDRRGDLRHHPAPERGGRRFDPAGRAECRRRLLGRDYGYIMESGQIVLEGPVAKLGTIPTFAASISALPSRGPGGRASAM